MEQPDKSNKNKSILGMVVGLITFTLSYFVVQQIFFKPPSYDQVMMQAASEINKTCPIMIDKETRLDNAIALPENVFQYNYTLVNMVKPTVDISQLENYVRPILINNVKTNPDMKINRDNKTTMGYYYKDKNGEFLFRILVTPDLYGN